MLRTSLPSRTFTLRRKPLRPRLEPLESRLAPSCFVGITNRVLEVLCNTATDVVSVDTPTPALTRVYNNGPATDWTTANFDRIYIRAGDNMVGDGDDVVQIQGIRRPTTIVLGFGVNRTHIGHYYADLSRLEASVDVNNGYDNTLIVDDRLNPTNGLAYYIFAGRIQREGIGPFRLITFNSAVLEVHGGSGTTTFWVNSTQWYTTLYTGPGVNTTTVLSNTNILVIQGQGALDNVILGNQGRMGGISHVYVFNRPAGGYTALTVNNYADLTERGALLEFSHLYLGCCSHIYFEPQDLRSLTINGAGGTNLYGVNDTPNSGFPGGVVTTLNAGSGVDTVYVYANRGPLVINGRGGLDNVTIGNNGSLAGILAPVSVSNPPAGGYTALTIDTSAFAGTYFADITDSAVSFGGVPINYVQADLRWLTLRGGRGNNAYRIQSTPRSGFPAGIITSIVAGAGNDSFGVAPATALYSSLGGRLQIDGGGGTDELFLYDHFATHSGTYTVEASSVAVTGGLPVDYGGIETLWLHGANGPNIVNINGTLVGTTIVQPGQGNDTVAIAPTTGNLSASLGGPLHVSGNSGDDALSVYDNLANHAGSYTLTPTSLTVIGVPPITYDFFESRQLNAAAGANTITVHATSVHAAVNGGGGDDVFALIPAGGGQLFLNGGAGANALDYSAYPADLYVNLRTGHASGALNGISNIHYVLGGPGNDVLVGAGNNVLAGGPGRDVLIGGSSPSVLFGDFYEDLGEDLIIAGTTVYDTSVFQLVAIRDYWASGATYETRVANLRNGAGVPRLDATTVTYNGGPNLYLGGGGRDFIYGRPDVDVFIDPEDGETVVPI